MKVEPFTEKERQMKKKSQRRAHLVALIIMLATSLLTSEFAQAEKTGNGGGAWVCREANGTIRWSQLVDLFEAENEFGLTLASYPGSVREVVDQLQLRISRVNQDLYESLIPYFEDVNYLENDPPDITYTEDVLTVVDDSLYRLKPSPKRCSGGEINYEQVVNYKNDGLILVQSEILNSFANSVKAALVFHEAIYAYLRDVAGDTVSTKARRMVGLILSTLSTTDLKKALEDLGEGSVNAIGMTFKEIQGGSFTMGSPENEPNRSPYAYEKQHYVTLTQDFEIQTTEVTQYQWFQVMGDNPSKFSKPENCPQSHKVIKSIGLCPNHPVERVSFDDVQEFIGRLNLKSGGYFYRLPTEAEWEYAARAGTSSAYSFGDNASQLFKYGIYSVNSGNQTAGVGKRLPNKNGLHDMHGNVSEWVQDWYDRYPSNHQSDPIGPDYNWRGRVIRGGSWCDGAGILRSAHRTGQWDPSSVVGFRLVRTH